MFKGRNCFFRKYKREDVLEEGAEVKDREKVAANDEGIEVIPKSEWWKHRPYLESHGDLMTMEMMYAEKEIKLVQQIGDKRYQTQTRMSDLSTRLRDDRVEMDKRLVETNTAREKAMIDRKAREKQIVRNQQLIKEIQADQKKLRAEIKELDASIRKGGNEIASILVDSRNRQTYGACTFFVSRDNLPKGIVHIAAETPQIDSDIIDALLEPAENENIVDPSASAILR